MQSNNNLVNLILLLCGVVGPAIFMTACLLIGQSIPGYSATQNFVSFMTTGEYGWMERTNEVVAGLFIIAFGLGIKKFNKTLSKLVLAAGILALTTAIAATSTELWPGLLHRIAAAGFFVTVVVLITRSVKSIKTSAWKLYSHTTLIIIMIPILWAISLNPSFKGILQRVSIFAIQLWFISFAVYFFKKSTKSQPELVNQQ